MADILESGFLNRVARKTRGAEKICLRAILVGVVGEISEILGRLDQIWAKKVCFPGGTFWGDLHFLQHKSGHHPTQRPATFFTPAKTTGRIIHLLSRPPPPKPPFPPSPTLARVYIFLFLQPRPLTSASPGTRRACTGAPQATRLLRRLCLSPRFPRNLPPLPTRSNQICATLEKSTSIPNSARGTPTTCNHLVSPCVAP